MDALRALCLCGKDDASDGNSSDGDGAVVTTESAAPPHPVVEVDCRDFDDGTRNFRLERRSVVWYCETLAREVADAAVDCACDEAARHRLEARLREALLREGGWEPSVETRTRSGGRSTQPGGPWAQKRIPNKERNG